LNVRPTQVAASIELMDAGNTLPFIARYRKEVTGSLDEDQLRQVNEWLAKLRSLDERRKTVLKSILEQDKLTPELEQQVLSAETLTELEDLYQPYKPKRRTRASLARERGLQPLADMILEQAMVDQTLEELALPYLGDQVPGAEEAWAGARDIVAEIISDNADVRRITREKALQWGVLRCEKTAEADDLRQVYELYYDFEAGIDRLRPHQVLAINRGEKERVLAVRVIIAERDWRTAVASQFRIDPRSQLSEQLRLAIEDTAERLLLPAIERDVRRALSEKAETHAIHVFAENLRALLNQPPLSGHNVMGIDPGYRTGCKVAVVDITSKVLETETIYPHEPQNRWQEAKKLLSTLVRKHKVSLVTIGNGTASRETEHLVAELIREEKQESLEAELQYLIVNEAGASVYSASGLARAELPGMDVSLRGAVSIARRAQDPLAELVKIDPKSIGVGLYQHDIDQKQLDESLHGVVESAVNRVGVDVNTASPALLTYVAGIGLKLAEKIVAYRDEKGIFRDRNMIREVPGMGPRSFEQSAGFLRIREGNNPLDTSAIHPESYAVVEKVLELAEVHLDTPPSARQGALDELLAVWEIDQLAAELGTGVPTLQDILEQLVRPGRDPRQDVPAPILRSDVLKIEDLAPGMRLKGTVRNVVDFGAFIDIGVKQDGLLHRSQIPRETSLQVGDIIDVQINKVDLERGRIALRWSGS
jgi:uncharacterized protein